MFFMLSHNLIEPPIKSFKDQIEFYYPQMDSIILFNDEYDWHLKKVFIQQYVKYVVLVFKPFTLTSIKGWESETSPLSLFPSSKLDLISDILI